jgi:glycolate oxidase FAD binding subunit
MTRFRPSDERALAEIVAAAVAQEEALEIVAGGSKRGLGRPLQTPHVLDLGAFAGIRNYAPEELVLTAGAATPMREVENALAAKGQMLAFEPPDWRGLWGGDGVPTLGGVIACNLAGPRRIKAGAARDHFLGFRAVSGRGEAFKAGGKVVKNVTGYDLAKLIAGSYGTLAALTEVTVKVLPLPPEERSLVLRGLDDERALRAMTEALQSSHEVSGAAHLPAGQSGRGRPLTALRLEGPLPSVMPRAAALAHELGAFGAAETLATEASRALWRAVRDAAPLAGEPSSGSGARVLWRCSVPPSAGPALAVALSRALDARWFFDWGGGLVWLAVAGAGDGGAAVIRAAIAPTGGHATLIRAPDALRAAISVFEPQPPALAALTRRVKDAFDPKGVLNRGRMYADV